MDKLAKIIRVITGAPFMALFLLTVLYTVNPVSFGGITVYLVFAFFLTVLPLLSYAVHFVVPPLRRRGRKLQRDMAFIGCIAGYVGAVIYALCAGASVMPLIICCTYLLSVILLAVINAFTKWKASGHACGASGPVVSLLYFLGPLALQTVFAACVLAGLFWASLKTKRHSVAELLLGSLDSALAFAIVMVAVRLIGLI